MGLADGNRYLEETFSVPVWYVVKRFDFDRVCGLPDLFEDQKSLKKQTKKNLDHSSLVIFSEAFNCPGLEAKIETLLKFICSSYNFVNNGLLLLHKTIEI